MNLASKQLPQASGSLELFFADQGQGLPYLLLHGGAGPQSMAGLAAALQPGGRVVAPVLPGFAGTPRPDGCRSVAQLADACLALLEALDLQQVIVVGNSVGGWLAAEIALRDSPRVQAVVLLNACGVDTGQAHRPIPDPMAMAPAERAAAVFHDPARHALAPTTPEAAAAMAANQQALRVYAGEPFMHDPTLRQRLGALRVPALLLWGQADRIVDLAYGRRFAAAMPGARLVEVPQAGHFPQIEQPALVVQHIQALRGGATG